MMARLNNLDTDAILFWRDVRGSKLLPIRVRLKMLHNTLSMLHICTIYIGKEDLQKSVRQFLRIFFFKPLMLYTIAHAV